MSMPEKDPTLMARCLECDSRIYFERKPDLGEIIVCPECETSLEVVRISPIKFGWPDEGNTSSSPSGAIDLDEFFSNLDTEEEGGGNYDDDDDGGY
jgi:lysine biosynthesis protein LysW